MSTIADTVAELEADLGLFDSWEDRYRYILDLGKALAPLPDAQRTEATRVRGCASNAWLVSQRNRDGRLTFAGDSDAHIVRGLIAILVRLYSSRTPDEIAALPPETAFGRLGLKDALTAQRSNGLAAMAARIRQECGLPPASP